MEDEGFVDDDFIDDTARAFVGRYGFASLTVLCERAAIAEAAGDYLLAQTLAGNRRGRRADAAMTGATLFRRSDDARRSGYGPGGGSGSICGGMTRPSS